VKCDRESKTRWESGHWRCCATSAPLILQAPPALDPVRLEMRNVPVVGRLWLTTGVGVGQLRPSAVPMRSHAVPCALWAASDCGYKPKARWSLARHSQDEESVQKPINRKEAPPLIISALMALAVILPARRAWQELVMLLLESSKAAIIHPNGSSYRGRLHEGLSLEPTPCGQAGVWQDTCRSVGPVAGSRQCWCRSAPDSESRAQFSWTSLRCAMSECRPQCDVLRLASWWVARSLRGAVAVGPGLSLRGLALDAHGRAKR
jgi:hypothetical protein